MKNLLCLLLLTVHLSSAAAQALPRSLRYSFDLGDPTHLHITLTLSGRRAGSETVVLPSQWAGETELYKAVSNLRVTSPGAALSPTTSPARWLLRTRTAGATDITYDLSQDWSGPLKHPLEHRALLSATLFEFTGENGLVAPVIGRSEQVRVSFDFNGLPPGRALVTSFGTAPHQSFAGAWSSVRNALFTGGKMTTKTLSIDRETVLLAMHGEWAFAPEEIAGKVQRILSAERHLWRDTAVPYYAIVIAPYEDGSSGGGGSGFTNMSNLYLSDRSRFGVDAEALVAHEAFHHWVPDGLGSVEDMRAIAWFGEGFTTFYQGSVLVRAGILTEPEYVEALNKTIRDYALSPLIKLTNADLQRTALSDHVASEEPYLRGAMIALWLGAEIERQSAGERNLTDMMLALRADRAQPLTAERIFQTAGRFVDTSTVAWLRAFALDGATVPVPRASLGECIAFRDRPAWTFNLGFDSASLQPRGIVHGVEQGSNAYEAGVRNGQLLGGFSLWNGNAEREVTLTLQEVDGRRERLSFLPRGRLLSVPQAEEVPGCKKGPRIPG